MTKASDAGATVRPTDEELMLFVDGELEGARLDEVAAFAEHDVTARRKVTALRLAGSLLRDQALAPSVADGIADSVMRKIESSNGAGKVIPLRPAAAPIAGAPRSRDNVRRIFPLAALGLAAAAAFMVWQRSSDAPSATSDHRAPIALRMPPSSAPTLAAKPADTAAEVASKSEAESHGVEVAAVDFGTKSGSIFYVPSEAAPSMKTTAVVWINDDSAVP